tara:strand:+ start:887 stop:2008 length:1122 start_codon:yes stop_codon:yes gene_type:complete
MRFSFILLFSFFSLFGKAQLRDYPRRYLNKVFNDTTAISQQQFIYYPVVAYSPETSWEIGISALYVRYAKNDTSNRLSEINAFTFFTLAEQYGGFFEHAIYSDKNKWFFLGKMKFQSFPLSYFGIGANTSSEKLARVDAIEFQLKERVLYKLRKNFYTGFEFEFHHLGNVSFNESSIEFPELPLGSNGSTNFGVGYGLLYDNRHNILNVRKGFFAEAAFLHYDKSFGSDFEFTNILTDWRFFRPINKKNVLAFQFLGQFTLGDAPFNQLALMGGESMMRGYYTGRYRDNNLMAFQAEYRMLPLFFAKRLGATVFAGTAAVSDQVNNFESKNLVISGGSGLRFLLFPKKDVWTRLDFAFTREGNGIYLFIGEAF